MGRWPSPKCNCSPFLWRTDDMVRLHAPGSVKVIVIETDGNLGACSPQIYMGSHLVRTTAWSGSRRPSNGEPSPDPLLEMATVAGALSRDVSIPK